MKKLSVESDYRSLFENSLMGISQVDAEGNFIRINNAYAEMYGYPSADIMLKEIKTVTGNFFSNPDDRVKVLAEMDAKGFLPPGEFELKRRNGEKFWALVSARRIFDEKGKFRYTQADHIDITGLKTAEKELYLSNQRFKNSMDAAKMAWWEMDYRTGNVVFHRDKALMLGYKPEQFTHYSDFTRLIHPDDYSLAMKRMSDHLARKKPTYDVEYRIRSASGEYLWFRDLGGISESDEAGNPKIITGLVINISDRKHAEEKWRESEERYRLLSDQCGLGIGLFSIDGKIIYFNNKAISNLGNPSSTYIGKSLSDMFDKKTARKYINRFKEVVKSGRSIDYEDFFQSPASEFWFLSNHTKICDSKGELIGIQVIAHDITERKIIEKKLQESSQDLRELTHHFEELRENERSTIARDLHDDLGQKLTAIKMDISWLKSRIGVQSRPVERKFQQMDFLISDSIDSIQKISYGLRPSILDDLGLHSAIEWQLKEFSKLSGIKVKAVYSQENDIINSQLSLVIFRIVQEALTNVLRHASASSVEIKITDEAGKIKVIISDNGTGIELEKIESKKSYGLIGMRERVKANGGEIKISGKKGFGTVIVVKFPLKD